MNWNKGKVWFWGPRPGIGVFWDWWPRGWWSGWARPVFLFTIEGETAHGSGRSVEGFHFFKGLETLEDYLLGFGGHAAAAGATLMVKDLPSFEQAFESLVQDVGIGN